MAIRDKLSGLAITRVEEGPFLIIGLGNIGPEYAFSRHNAGFLALDAFAHTSNLGEFKLKNDLNALVLETSLDENKVILAKPTTLMNRSGLAVSKLQNYYKVNDNRILVVFDDVDIDFGTIRSKTGPSGSGGHNGIKSLESVIGPDFARIKIGVKNDTLAHHDTADFVLKNFSKAEQENLPAVLEPTCKLIGSFLTDSLQAQSLTV